MRRILWKEKESPNFARSGVIHVLTKTSVALIDNNIAKNGESRPIIALVEIIIIIIIMHLSFMANFTSASHLNSFSQTVIVEHDVSRKLS